MNIVDLIKDRRIPWVIIDQISEFNRASIHGFVREDLVIFNTMNVIKKCFCVKYYGGVETLGILTTLARNLQFLKTNHPDWKYRSRRWEETTKELLRTYVKMARGVVTSTPQDMIEDPAFVSFWAYIAEIFEILLDGCNLQQPRSNSDPGAPPYQSQYTPVSAFPD